MADEHRHHFKVGPMEDSPVCAVCGGEAVDLVQDLQQQLAQARKDTTYLRSERLKLEAKVRFERELNAIQLKQRLRLQHDLDQAQALIKDAAQVIDAEWGASDEGPTPLETLDKLHAFLTRPEGDSDDE